MAESLTLKQAAAELGVHPMTIYRWLWSGKLRGWKLGGRKLGWRIARTELDRLLREAEEAGNR